MQASTQQARATRFCIPAPVRYRVIGEEAWRVGDMVNVSRSGVLFQTFSPLLPAETCLEFILAFENLEVPGTNVRCVGRVVRCRAGPEGTTTLAATIDRYRFVRTEVVDSSEDAVGPDSEHRLGQSLRGAMPPTSRRRRDE
jgi:hypothetical protein